MAEPINNVRLVGGTHGNELTGVRLVEHWQTIGPTIECEQTRIETLIANPAAVDQRVRYVDDDLNRQFCINALAKTPRSKEAHLAQALNQKWGTSSKEQPDLVIDVHNTTSQMGATLILLDKRPFNQQLARFVGARLPSCNILLEDDKSYDNHPYLCTLGKYGLMIEMGAQPHGVCRADIFSQTLELLRVIFAFIPLWNSASLPHLPEATVFQFIENILFPLNDHGRVTAMVSPQLQDRDFHPCQTGDPIFQLFSGDAIHWQKQETVYPHFINEAAYQGSKVAFAIARKIHW